MCTHVCTLELQMVVGPHVSAENRTQALLQSSKCSKLISPALGSHSIA